MSTIGFRHGDRAAPVSAYSGRAGAVPGGRRANPRSLKQHRAAAGQTGATGSVSQTVSPSKARRLQKRVQMPKWGTRTGTLGSLVNVGVAGDVS